MRRVLVVLMAVTALMLAASVAFADSTHECQGNSCNGTGGAAATSNAVSVSTSRANAEANAVGIGVGGQGGNANVTNHNTNLGVNAQGQKQGQSQNNNQTISPSQSYEGSYSGSQSVSIEGTRFDRYAPAVVAPGLTSAGTGVCLGSVSFGLSGPMVGATVGFTKVDKGCERRSNAALLYQFGMRDAALRMLMNDDEVREAVEGKPEGKPVSFKLVTPEDHVNVRTFDDRYDNVQGN